MNVSLQNIDKVSAELTVKLEKADYQEKVDKELKSLRQKAQIPGFRKGMVPTSLIKKMYGKSVIAEVVNKTLQEAVYNYIKENKVNMLGEPLPNEEKQQNMRTFLKYYLVLSFLSREKDRTFFSDNPQINLPKR